MNDARINFEKDLRRNEKIQRNKLQNNELEQVTEES